MKRITMSLLLLVLAALPVSAQDPSLKALLVTGQNNHNWELSHPILKTILEDTGLFQVEIALSPPAGEDMSGFTPAFKDYNVVVLDYTGDDWPEPVRQAFLEYVRGGGGVVVYHAADNAFPEWPEFNEIIGLGGWGDRTERHGPYVYWRDGEIVRDMRPGPGGSHGKQHQFVVTHRVVDHPVTKGLPEAWLHETDELYHHLRGPAINMTLLATAFSDPATNGSGEHEPVLFTIAYGQGRVFHTVLGHAGDDPPPALQCAGFIVTLQRGAEWAATGNVTQPVPDDFPTADRVRLRPQFKQASPDKLLRELAAYTPGNSLETLIMLEELARSRMGAGEPLDDLEAGYLALLKSADATPASKSFACKQLSLFGGPAAVPVLAALLRNGDTAPMARYALQRIPGNESLRALRNALPAAKAEQRAGILNSLGVRRDKQGMQIIAAYVHDGDERVASAAIEALASLGTPRAADLLLAVAEMKEGALKQRARDGYLRCGFALVEGGQKKKAAGIFRTASRRFKEDAGLRAAALRGRIALAQEKAGEVIVNTLQKADPEMCAVAATAVREVTDPQALGAIAALLPAQPAPVQARLITALYEARAPGISGVLVQATGSEDASVRIAALQALCVIGDASAAGVLLQRAASGSGREQDIARTGLARIPGASPVLLEALRGGDPVLRPEILKAVVARRLTEATPLLLELMANADGQARTELLEALTQVADAEHLDRILPMLMAAEPGKESAPLLDVVASAAKRSDGNASQSGALVEALKTEQNPAARRNLYAALGKIADSATLPVFGQGLAETDPAMRLAVVQALGAWPDAAPMELLRQAAEQFKGTPEGSAAITGFLRLAALDETRAGEDTAGLCLSVLPFAARTEDKQACIAALGKTGAGTALPTLYEAADGPDAELAGAAVRALSTWPDAAPMGKLEALAKHGPEALRLDALRGYFRVIGLNRDISKEEAVTRYKEALALAPTPDEQKRILSGLAAAETLGALQVAAEHVANPEVKEEAEVAVVKIAGRVAGQNPSQVRAILDQVNAGTENTFVKDEIAKISQQVQRFEDYITVWEMSGPYTAEDNAMKTLFDSEFPPEREDGGTAASWRPIPVGTNEGMPFLVELDKALGGDNRAAYLRTRVWSDAAKEAVLELGSDDGVKVWMNGQQVFAKDVIRPAAPGQDKAPVQLNEGWNTLLVKVTQGSAQWCLCARLRTVDGAVLEGIRTSLTMD